MEADRPEAEEEDAFEEKPKVPIILAKKAFKKWKDHRPTFDEMHSEDQKRRPRWWQKGNLNHCTSDTYKLVFY